MTKFSNVQRKELPDIWIARKARERNAPVTTAQVKVHYRLQTDEEAEQFLMRLVRDRRVRRLQVDGETRWASRTT